jgi:hypothetical protein
VTSYKPQCTNKDDAFGLSAREHCANFHLEITWIIGILFLHCTGQSIFGYHMFSNASAFDMHSTSTWEAV